MNRISIRHLVMTLILSLALACPAFLCSCITVTFEPSNSGNSASVSNVSSASNAAKQDADQKTYTFRSKKLLNEHYDKHGKEMGFKSASEYEKAASAVVNNPKALHKIEKEDGDDVYYVEATNDFVILSTDGFIRTYFRPDSGKSYFNRQ